MNTSYIVTIINRFSLIFSICNVIFAALGYENTNGLMFVWASLAIIILYNIKKSRAKLVLPFIGLAYFPLFIATSIDEFIFSSIVMTFGIFILFKGLDNNEYDEELTAFKRGLYVCTALLIACVITLNIKDFSDYSAVYIIIYMVSSVILLRTLRFTKYNKDSREAMKISFRYSIALAALSFILSVSYVRDAIINGVLWAYNFLINSIMYVFSWLFMGVGYALESVMSLFWKIIGRIIGHSADSGGEDLGKIRLPLKKLQEMDKESFAELLAKNKLLGTIFKIAILLIVVYFVIRIFRTFFSNKKREEDCIESVEFIKNDKKKGIKSAVNDFVKVFKGRDMEDHVRWYYKKFMYLCIENDILIQKGDTTLDINNKSRSIFNNKLLSEFRNIYIRVRYGNKAYDKTTIKDFTKHYNQLKKESSKNQEKL